MARDEGVLAHEASPDSTYKYDDVKEKDGGEMGLEKQYTIHEGEEKFKKLGWKKLTVCLIVEAIALGSLSIPKAFADVGMVAGIILSLGIGCMAIYTSYVVGQVKIKYPHIMHYSEAVQLIWGKFGYWLSSVMFVLLLVLLVGSHALTGTIAWIRIVNKPEMCALVFSVVSAIILFALAIPPTFAEFAWLGYIDFVSIILAILITIIATGVEASHAPGGLSAVQWSAWPPPDITFYSAFLAVTNIIFAYSFAVCQFSFMAELHTPTDYTKSIYALGIIEMFIYTLTGALVYAFVGQGVESPALLSSSFTVSRIAFGIALPVVFISGSINGTVVCRFIMDRAFADSPIRFITSKRAWTIWLSMLVAVTLIGWLIAEAVPFFSDLLGLISALFISGFSWYFPPLFWFQLIKEGKWNANKKNIILSVLNVIALIIGIGLFGCGAYAAVADIKHQYGSGSVRGAFTCDSSGYA